MRKPVIEQSKNFLRICKTKNTYVFKTSEIKKSIRDYIVSVDNWFSPYNWIYVVKKSTETKNLAIKKNIYKILSLLWWVFSRDFVLKYKLWKKTYLNTYDIIIPRPNFTWYLWDDKKIKINFKYSKKNRITEKIKIDWAVLEIESSLSYIVNNIKDMKDDKDFIQLVLSKRFDDTDIKIWMIHWYKISWLSKLAIMYKNYWKKGQYLIIKNAIEENWKKLDRRRNKVKIETAPKIQPKKEKISLDDELI